LVMERLEERTLLSAVGVSRGDYYLYNGAPVALDRALDEVLVKLEPGRGGEVWDRLKAQGTLSGAVRIQASSNAAVWSIRLPGVTTEANLDAFRMSLAADPDIEWAATTFVQAGGDARIAATNEVVVALRPGVNPAHYFASSSFVSYRPLRGTTDQFIAVVNAEPGPATVALANVLTSGPDVAWVTPDFMAPVALNSIPTDPLISSQWHIRNTGQLGGVAGADIDAFDAWSLGATGAGVVVAVLDSGVDAAHPDLAANMFINPNEIPGNGIDDDGNGYVDDVSGWNFVFNNNDTRPNGGNAHGTAAAGMIAAVGNNGIGIAGPAYSAKIMPIVIATSDGFIISGSLVAEAVYYAAGRTANGVGTWGGGGAGIQNHSWGGSFPNSIAQAAFDWTATNGRGGLGSVNFAATGNNGSGSISFPAGYSSVIAVGATTNRDVRASFSQYGSGLDIVAAGENVFTTDVAGSGGYSTGDYAYASGTSFSTPLAAGVGAMILGTNPTLTFTAVRQLLRDTADKIGPPGTVYGSNGWNNEYGWGRVNAGEAILRIALELTVAPPTNLMENTAYANLRVGELFFRTGSPVISEYSARVTMAGNPTPIQATLTPVGAGRYAVNIPGYTFPEGGSYGYTVAVFRGARQLRSSPGTIVVGDLPMSGQGVTITGAEGDRFVGTVATFSDLLDPDTHVPEAYAANIDWGDGTSSFGVVESTGVKTFRVVADHLFAGGDADITVRIFSPGGGILTVMSRANITDSVITITTAQPFVIRPTEGTPFQGALVAFVDADPRRPPASNYVAVIDWGDGVVETGIIASNPQGAGYVVRGSHVYNYRPTAYPISVVVRNNSGPNTATATGMAIVEDAPIRTKSLTGLAAQEGASFKGFVAVFSDGDPRPQPAARYEAEIDWGDGQKTLGRIVPNIDGGFIVEGSYAYPRAGLFRITTRVRDLQGDVNSFGVDSGLISVSPAALGVTIMPSEAISEGVEYTSVVATFASANLQADASFFSSTITWGDGEQTPGIIVMTAPGRFQVLGGGKVYRSIGTYTLGVEVASASGAFAGDVTTIEVTDAPIVVSAVGLTGQAKTELTNLLVATFEDGNKEGNAGEFAATITWGDGTASTPGVITRTGPGVYEVRGSHRFATSGTFTMRVEVVSLGRTRYSDTAQAIMAPREFPLTAQVQGASGGTNAVGSVATITGTSEPGATVRLFAPALGANAQVGTGIADGSGNWTIVLSGLADGSYLITGSAVDRFGNLSSRSTELFKPLIVDTAGPKVGGVYFDLGQSSAWVELVDPGAGVDLDRLLDPAIYQLTVLTRRGTSQPYAVNTIEVLSTDIPGTILVRTEFAGLKALKGGSLVLRLSAQGIRDYAGNGLDERYFVPFPATFAKPGSDYVARFNIAGRTTGDAVQYIPPRELQAAEQHRVMVRTRSRGRR
jgi:subtilisin family serine protease